MPGLVHRHMNAEPGMKVAPGRRTRIDNGESEPVALITEAVEFKRTTAPVIPQTASVGIQGFPDSVHLLHEASHVVDGLSSGGARVKQLKLHLEILKTLARLSVLQGQHTELSIHQSSHPVGTADRRHKRITAGIVIQIEAVDLISTVCRSERQRGRLQIASEEGVLKLTDQNDVELEKNTGFAAKVSRTNGLAEKVVVGQTNEPVRRDDGKTVVVRRIKAPLHGAGTGCRLREFHRRPVAPKLCSCGIWITNLNDAIVENSWIQHNPSCFKRLKRLGKTQRFNPLIELTIALKIQTQTGPIRNRLTEQEDQDLLLERRILKRLRLGKSGHHQVGEIRLI